MIFARRVRLPTRGLAPPPPAGEGSQASSPEPKPLTPGPSPAKPGEGSRIKARRAVLTAAGVLLLAHLGLNLALDTARPNWRDPEAGWRVRRLQAADARPLVLALGTSRTQMGLDPAAAGLADVRLFNFGQAGSEPRHLWLNYHRLRDAGVRPAAVLIEVMPATLAAAGGVDVRFRDHLSRLSAADVGRLTPHADDPAGFRRDWLLTRLTPWHTYRSPLLSHAAPWLLPWRQRVDFQWKTMTADGWVPYLYDTLTPADRDRLTKPVHDQYAATLANFGIAPAADAALRELIADAQNDGVRVALYRMPEGPTFRSWYGPGAMERVRRYLEMLSADYTVPVFDATDWLPDEAFGDGHHPTRTGAAAFSRRFGAEHLRPWLSRP